MPLPVIAGTVRAAVRGTCPSGQPWINVHHFQYAAGASNPGPTEINLLDVEVDKFYAGPIYAGGTTVLQQCKNNVTMADITYTPLDGSSLSIVKAHAHPGASASTATQSSEVSAVLTLRTSLRGRRYRGRIFLPPLVYDIITATGDLNPTTCGLFTVNYAGFIAALATKQWVPVVASYGRSVHKNGTVTTWTPFATPVVNATMDTKPDVQRRRK